MSDGRLPARRRWAGATIGIILTLLLLALGWVFVRGVGAVNELQQVALNTSQLRTAISDGNLKRVDQVAPRIASHASSAVGLTTDPVWRTFELVPWLGANFSAVREIAEITFDVASTAVGPVLASATEANLATVELTGSIVDLGPLPRAEASLATASALLSAAETRAQQINLDTILAPVADAVGSTRELIAESASFVGALHGASVLLPSMLGDDGPRTYILAVQNSAELRSNGGAVSALMLLRANGGRINVERQVALNEIPALDEPLPLSDAAAALFGDEPGRRARDATAVPDFAEAAILLAQHWEGTFGEQVDGVIVVDTAVAAHLVDATGPISFGAFTADADTITQILHSEIYTALADPAEQSAVYHEALRTLINSTLGSNEPAKVVSALADAAEEGRIRLWSAHEDEQSVLAASSLGGAILADGARGTHVGVLINDRTGGKMNFYTAASISTTIGVCQGEPTTQVRVTWTNNAPRDAAESLPPSVTTKGSEDLEPGEVRTLIAVYGPERAALRAFDRDGNEEEVRTTALGTRDVVQHDVLLAPGDSTTITVLFSGAGERRSFVHHTPLLTEPDMPHEDLVCD